MKSKKGKENLPLVTWITMEPETSTRTSLKSFADYLSEMQEDIPMPERRLCLSPETLNALHNAEKLVEDAEKQLSQMEVNALVVDDIDDNTLDERRMEDDKLYVRNIVTTMFKKGYYEPGPKTVIDRRNKSSKSIATEFHSRKQYSSPKTSKSVQRITEVNRNCDECLVCKSNKSEPTKEKSLDPKVVESSSGEQAKIEEDKPEKLNIQKGPSISIKANFSVQTKSIIDIQPDESSSVQKKIQENNLDNIATYEYRHSSCSKAKSDISIINEESIRSKQDKSENKRRRKHVNKLSPRKVDLSSYFWKPFDEIIEFDLDDFSLKEPGILTEVDCLLDQQRKIISKVHDATEKFDIFLSKRTLDESSSKETKSKKNQRIRNDLQNSVNLSTSVESILKSEEILSSKEKNSIVKDVRSFDLPSHKENSIQPSSRSESLEKETSKDVEKYSNSDISIRLERSETDLRKIDNEISSNKSSIIHTETKSNAGFIENLKSLQTLKESNLIAADIRRNDKTLEDIRIIENVKSSENFLGNVAEKENGEDEKSLEGTVTEDERELQNYVFEHFSDKETIEPEKNKNEKSNENSQKTSHLIESISVENNDESLESASNDNKNSSSQDEKSSIHNLTDGLTNAKSKSEIAITSSKEREMENKSINKERTESISSSENNSRVKSKTNEDLSNRNESTESKIESLLSEARNNFNNLMRTTSDKNNTSNHSNVGLIQEKKLEEKSNNTSEITAQTKHNNIQDVEVIEHFKIPIAQDCNTTQRSIVSMLEDNGNAVSDSSTQHRLSLLKKLESCSIPNTRQSKRLFTSTVIGDTEPPNCFTKSKASSTIRSESSSDTHSEGEVCFSSSGSYSVGEMRRKAESSSSTGEIVKSHNDMHSTLIPSAGEICEDKS